MAQQRRITAAKETGLSFLATMDSLRCDDGVLLGEIFLMLELEFGGNHTLK
jgi:hypothetical protein